MGQNLGWLTNCRDPSYRGSFGCVAPGFLWYNATLQVQGWANLPPKVILVCFLPHRCIPGALLAAQPACLDCNSRPIWFYLNNKQRVLLLNSAKDAATHRRQPGPGFWSAANSRPCRCPLQVSCSMHLPKPRAMYLFASKQTSRKNTRCDTELNRMDAYYQGTTAASCLEMISLLIKTVHSQC